MNKYQISHRNFGVEIEFQKQSGQTRASVAQYLRVSGFHIREIDCYEHTQAQPLKWTLKLDGSLEPNGLQICSPQLHGEAGLDEVRRMVVALGAVANTDQRCGIHVHHEVGKIADRIQKRTIRNVYRVYRAAQEELNEKVLESWRHHNTYFYPPPAVEKVSSIRLKRLPRHLAVNFQAVNLFGTLEFRQLQSVLDADKVEGWGF